MKSTITLFALALIAGTAFARVAQAPDAAAASAVAASGGGEPGTPQRLKMKTCNADARTKDLHGAERKAFMKQCLSKAKPATAS